MKTFFNVLCSICAIIWFVQFLMFLSGSFYPTHFEIGLAMFGTVAWFLKCIES